MQRHRIPLYPIFSISFPFSSLALFLKNGHQRGTLTGPKITAPANAANPPTQTPNPPPLPSAPPCPTSTTPRITLRLNTYESMMAMRAIVHIEILESVDGVRVSSIWWTRRYSKSSWVRAIMTESVSCVKGKKKSKKNNQLGQSKNARVRETKGEKLDAQSTSLLQKSSTPSPSPSSIPSAHPHPSAMTTPPRPGGS